MKGVSKMKTALIRNMDGNLEIYRSDRYRTNSDMAYELRGNGFKVLKIWNGDIDEDSVMYWLFLNRK